ncbi:hypothetical protein RHMOL_Rhmol09G0117900 [Rhododendron molle]|uniref:Uncharacterized protein n=1 Tax=Rhododendron molle TaxID=49168 RepID=A0ACC0MDG2_RHOML|nr:hypothetical protein RHMOL_Rhmol09G0117900 [Rhododendron molle]
MSIQKTLELKDKCINRSSKQANLDQQTLYRQQRFRKQRDILVIKVVTITKMGTIQS